MIRSIVSIIGGYLIFAVSAALLFQLSGVDPHKPPDTTFIVISIIYGCVFAALGGYVSGLSARQNEIKHSIALTILLAAIATISLFFAQGDRWTEISTIFLMAPCAIIGGFLRKKQKGT